MNESGHWYTTTGEPMHFVPKAKGDGTRRTTITDARKLGLLPSVTSVLGILRKPALERWLIQQAVQAVVTAPDMPGESLDAKLERVLEVERQQDQESKNAMDLGTRIHEALEQRLSSKPFDAVLADTIAPVVAEVARLGNVVATEKIVVGDGYAGKTDLVLSHPSGDLIVIDFKTTKKLPDKGSWPEKRLQLAMYAKALAKPPAVVRMVGNIYISTTEPGKWCSYTWPDWENDAEIGAMLVKIWQWQNQYVPNQGVTTA